MMNKKGHSRIGMNRVLFGIIFMMLVVGVVCVNVRGVRGEAWYFPGQSDLYPTMDAAIKEDPTQIPQQVPGAENLDLGSSPSSTKISADGKTLTTQDGANVNLPPEGSPQMKVQNGHLVGSDGSATSGSGKYNVDSNGHVSGASADATTQLPSQTPGTPGPTVTGEAANCGPSNGAGPGKGGGGGGGGAGEQKLGEKAFAAAQQAMGVAAQVGGPIKEALKKQPNPPVLYIPDGASGKVSVPSGEAVALVDSKGNVQIVIGQAGGSTYSWNGQGVTVLKATNGNAVGFVNGNAVGQSVTPLGVETPITLKANPVNPTPTTTTPPSTNPSTNPINKFFLPFIRSVDAEDSITGNAIIGTPDQFIKFIEFNIEMQGRDNIVRILKPFDKVNGMGTNLNVIDGNVTINFKNMKTNYPRLVHMNGYFINEIRNEYDDKNLFKMIPNGSKGNYFTDGRYRLTVGDSVVKNPLQGYENVKIPQTRYEMWKRAIDGEYIS